MNEIGEMLSHVRESSGVSIKEVSNDLGIDEVILENIEEGKTGAFKDIFELKNYLSSYAKYLGLDENQIIDEFNEYIFEYTSKIPIKEIEKTIELQMKENKDEKIVSPYTRQPKKYNNYVYILVYVFVLLMVLVAFLWSVKQVTIGTKETSVISYRR